MLTLRLYSHKYPTLISQYYFIIFKILNVALIRCNISVYFYIKYELLKAKEALSQAGFLISSLVDS